MSKVYVVTVGEYSDEHIYAVLSTRDKADALKEYLDTFDYCNIEEHVIDEYTTRETVAAYVSPREVWFLDSSPKEEYVRDSPFGDYIVLTAVHYNPNRDIMVKAARDRAAMIRAREEGI